MADGQTAKAEPPGSRSSAATLEIKKHIKDLTSQDFAARDRSVIELEKFGKPAAQALVDRLFAKPVSHNMLRMFEEAFEEIGKPSIDVLVNALKNIPEIKKAEDVYLVGLFVDSIALVGDRRVSTPVAEQLEKLNRRIKANHNRLLTDVCVATKLRIHKALAGFDSKEGLIDLLAMLGDGRRRVPDGVVASLEQIGDRRAILPLVRLYAIEEAVSFSGALAIKGTIRDIIRREKIGSKDRLKDFNAEERTALEKLAGWGK